MEDQKTPESTSKNRVWIDKLYQPDTRSDNGSIAVAEIGKTMEVFLQQIGPKSAEFVKLLIEEEKPDYPNSDPDKINRSMIAHARGLQETGNKDPFGLFGFASAKQSTILKRIEETKMRGAADGISEQNNSQLATLGEALVFVSGVIREIVSKFPSSYSEVLNKTS